MSGTGPGPDDRAAFRRTLARALTIQALALAALWILQLVYTP